MKTTLLAALLALAPAWLAAQPAPETPDQIAGLRMGQITAPHHGRAMDYALCYPALGGQIMPHFGNAVFLPVMVAPAAAPEPGRHPVVLLSHGLGGHYRSLGWLATGLAEAGAIVLAVNHPHSSAFDFDMQKGLQHWTRAQDLSLALDHLLADPEFGPMIDPARISAAGFSYGGWTALSLGGVRGNLAGYRAHCATSPTSHCADIARAGAALGKLDAAVWDGTHADPRISRVAAIDPGLTYGLTGRDVADLDLPTLLVQLGTDADRLASTGLSDEGSGFAGRVPAAHLVEIAPAAHFSVLPLCTQNGATILAEENDDPVCTDPDGTDRATLHAQVLQVFIAYLGLD